MPVSAHASPRQTWVSTVSDALVGAVHEDPARLERAVRPRPAEARARSRARRRANRRSRPRSPRRSTTAAWWMWPPRISSAPAPASRRKQALLRPLTGSFVFRHGAPVSWWWSATTRSAPSGAAREPGLGTLELMPLRRARAGSPSGRTEQSPTISSPGAENDGESVSQQRSNSRYGRVKRAGRPGRDVVVAGDRRGAAGRAPRRYFAAASCSARRPRCVRSPLATTTSGDDALDELADRPLERRVVEAVPRAEMEVRHVEDAR